MELQKEIYKDLNKIFKFNLNPIEKFKTVDKARKALEDGKWGKTNLLIPKDDIKGWFKLATEALQKNKRVIIITTFNPHYKYWFKYAWPWASKMLLYTKNCIKFKGYDNPSPKTVTLILFDPKHRKTPRKDLIKSYVDGKFPYFSLPLKVHE